MLDAFGLLTSAMPLEERVGQVAIQCVPASFGAMIARKQPGDGQVDEDAARARQSARYGAQLFLMVAGALFIAFNVAPLARRGRKADYHDRTWLPGGI